MRAEAYDVSHFPELKDQYGAMSVPCIVITHADGIQNSAKRASPPNVNWSARKPHDLRYQSNNNDSAKIVTHRLMRSMRRPAESLFTAALFIGLRTSFVPRVLGPS